MASTSKAVAQPAFTTPKTNVRLIRNGSKYPLPVKTAAVRNSKKVGKIDKLGSIITVAKIASEHGVSPSILKKWRQEASIQNPLPAGLARHQAAAAEVKEYNTPTLVMQNNKGEWVTASVGKATHVAIKGKYIII